MSTECKLKSDMMQKKVKEILLKKLNPEVENEKETDLTDLELP